MCPELKLMCKKSESFTELTEYAFLSAGSDRGQESNGYFLSPFGSLCEMRQ